jgi:hypothetical protein
MYQLVLTLLVTYFYYIKVLQILYSTKNFVFSMLCFHNENFKSLDLFFYICKCKVMQCVANGSYGKGDQMWFYNNVTQPFQYLGFSSRRKSLIQNFIRTWR